MKYRGQCYCGRMQFEVQGQLSGVLASRDSLRSRRGSLLWLLPMAQFQVNPNPQQATSGQNFCVNCGLYPYVQKHQSQTQAMLALDIRCLEKVSLDQLRITNLLGHIAQI